MRRNALAVALLPVLPPDLTGEVVDEFRKLVSEGYAQAAAGILTSGGWPHRDVLLKSLVDAPEDQRRQFANSVYSLGFDVEVPGIPKRGSRPWN